jgi:hemerythrin
MPFLPWKDEYSVGVPLFDEQHQKMFGYINDLDEAIAGVEERAVLRKIMKGLIDYTRLHFGAEEYNLKLYNYEGYDKHKEEHDKLTREVIEYAYNFFKTPGISTQIMNFLNGWILNHILETDKQYTEFFVDKEIIDGD